MTTNSIILEKEFFFLEKLQNRVINPRSNERSGLQLLLDKNGNGKHLFQSNYDVEVFPWDDEAHIICNIKTKMLWNFEAQNKQDLGSYAFAESLLFNFLNQKHFATTILKQEVASASFLSLGMLRPPKIEEIYTDLKEQFDFLAPLNFIPDKVYDFGHWYH